MRYNLTEIEKQVVNELLEVLTSHHCTVHEANTLLHYAATAVEDCTILDEIKVT